MDTKKVIKFFASWCGPCKIYAKTWEQVTPTYSDQVEFLDIDIDTDTTGLVVQHKIKSVPTTILIREDGSELKKVGRLTTEELIELILS